MSMLPHEPDHFARWLIANHAVGSGAPRGDISQHYVPRALYGDYLRETFDRAVRDARCRVEVDVVEGTAVDLRQLPVGYVVRTACGEVFTADAVALCLGNGRCALPVDRAKIAPATEPRLISDPFADLRSAAIDPDASTSC